MKEELKEKTNWSDSDELALMFRNTFRPEFYKELHRYVHKIYRKKQAGNAIKHIIQAPFMTSGNDIKKACSILYYIPSSEVYKYRLKQHKKINA